MEKRSVIKTIFWRTNVVLAILLSLGWLTFYLPPGSSTVLSIVSFIVPILLVVHFLFLLFWTAKKSKKSLLSLLWITISFLIFGTFYRFSPAQEVGVADSFSVMSYNVRNLNKNEQMPISNVDSSIIKFVLNQSPDILVVQEAHYAMRRTTPLDKTYPYKFVDFEYGVPKTNVINALYSKYPIADVQLIDFPKSDNGALFADILITNDTIRVYNAHLQSFRVVPDVEHLQNEESGKLLKRILRGLRMQEEQASIIRDHMNTSPHPIVVCGDFNNTQFSKVYRLLKGKFSDSFSETGSSFGKTFEIFEMPLRIDYIFADENFEMLSHTNYNIALSDHEPISAKMVLKPNK